MVMRRGRDSGMNIETYIVNADLPIDNAAISFWCTIF